MLPKLYGYWRSSASWRVRWALELKKIPYEYVPVNILEGKHKSPEHLARNPMGTLPVMEISPGEFLSQSMAILFWIEENTFKMPMIFGVDRTQRYKILELCEIINADTAPLQTPRAQKKHSSNAEEKSLFAKSFIEEGLTAFNSLITTKAGPYCLGQQVSAADLFLVPQMYNAKRFGIDLSLFPKLNEIWKHCLQTPECVKSSPEKQVDAIV